VQEKAFGGVWSETDQQKNLKEENISTAVVEMVNIVSMETYKQSLTQATPLYLGEKQRSFEV
jgi:hypothetical protein